MSALLIRISEEVMRKRHSLTELLHSPRGLKAVRMSRDPMVTYSKISKKTHLKKNVLIRLFKLAGTIGRRKGRKLVRRKPSVDTRMITLEDLISGAEKRANHYPCYGAYGSDVVERTQPNV